MSNEAMSAGKYAAYIWPAYAVSVLGFAWMVIDTLARARRWKRRADRLEGERESLMTFPGTSEPGSAP